jgi:glyoxylase-like metal-dependent hydrolase (beta-lactamase superfamily II)
MTLRATAAIAVLTLGIAYADQAAQAQPASGPAPAAAATASMTTHAIKPGKLYWVEGGGGNSGVIIAAQGVILVDAKISAETGSQLVAEVAKLTSKPITHVILTHSDGDHVNGLAGMPAGLKIIAHVNNKAELLATHRFATVEVGGGRCLPPLDRLPNQIVATPKVAVNLAGEPVVLHYFGAAHTAGDLVVELPRDRVAFVGDLITSNVLVHPEKSGSLAGWFANARAILALPAQAYIGGHATKPDTKVSLRERMTAYQAIRDKVAPLVDSGMTLAEVKRAVGDPEKDPSGCRGIPFPSVAEVEFNERTDRNQQLR